MQTIDQTKTSVYARAGIAPLINAMGTVTILGGSVMPPEVIAAMNEAAKSYVDVPLFHERGGKYLAELIGVPGVFISSGAAGGIAVAIAAALTGNDAERAYDLPRTSGPNEIIVAHSGRPNYMYQAAEMVGGKLVEVGSSDKLTVDDFARAITSRTAAILFVYAAIEPTWAKAGAKAATIASVGQVAHAAGIPLIVDAAAELPPREKLTRFHREGADLAIFSGGKGIFGPQATGLVVGRADLVSACRLNGSPSSSVGRGMKIGKEEMAGIIRAVEIFMSRDEKSAFDGWRKRAQTVADRLAGIPGIAVRVLENDPRGRPPEAARCFVEIQDASLGSGRDVVERLKQGSPPIHSRALGDCVIVDPVTLQDGEAEIVGERLAKILRH